MEVGGRYWERVSESRSHKEGTDLSEANVLSM